ncbi:hypothetical protein [Bartonella sp. B30(2025)]
MTDKIDQILDEVAIHARERLQNVSGNFEKHGDKAIITRNKLRQHITEFIQECDSTKKIFLAIEIVIAQFVIKGVTWLIRKLLDYFFTEPFLSDLVNCIKIEIKDFAVLFMNEESLDFREALVDTIVVVILTLIIFFCFPKNDSKIKIDQLIDNIFQKAPPYFEPSPKNCHKI